MNDRTHTSHRLRRTIVAVAAGIVTLAVSGTAAASPVGSVGVAGEVGTAYVTNGTTGTISVRVASSEVFELDT
jgi:hypothetical protein